MDFFSDMRLKALIGYDRFDEMRGKEKKIQPGPLKYIEGTGTQWIDTGYSPKNDTVNINFVCTITNNSGRNDYFGTIASNDQYGNKRASYGFSNSYGTGTVYLGTEVHQLNGSGDPTFTNNSKWRFNVSARMMYGYLNDSSSYAFAIPGKSGYTCLGNILLFASQLIDRDGSVSNTHYCSKIRLYSCYISEWNYDTSSREIVRDFTPYRDVFGVPCLYDSITNRLYYNQGTGQFLYGELDPQS